MHLSREVLAIKGRPSLLATECMRTLAKILLALTETRHSCATTLVLLSVPLSGCYWQTTSYESTGTSSIEVRASDGQVIFSDEDIVFYSWDTHTFTLRHGLREELRETYAGQLVGGVPFELVVNGDTRLAGFMTSSFSSYSLNDIAIDLDSPYLSDKNQLRLDIGYPPQELDRDPDPRHDETFYEALNSLLKLRIPS